MIVKVDVACSFSYVTSLIYTVGMFKSNHMTFDIFHLALCLHFENNSSLLLRRPGSVQVMMLNFSVMHKSHLVAAACAALALLWIVKVTLGEYPKSLSLHTSFERVVWCLESLNFMLLCVTYISQ